MSIRISKGGSLFGIMAGVGGAAMIGSAALTWIVLGFFVIAGAACFIALGSRRMRMTASALVVLAAAAGLVIALADRHSPGRVWGAWGRSWPLALGLWPCSVRSGRPPRLARPGARPRTRPAQPHRETPRRHISGGCPMPLARLDRGCQRDCSRRCLRRGCLEHVFGPHGAVLTALSGTPRALGH